MAQALTPPFLLAALVLCVAGAAKLRSPAAAVRALAALGLARGARAGLVRAFAVGELALGAWCLLAPARLAAGALACLYAIFSGLALLLARRRSSCGCFGEGDGPASIVQSLLSAALALVALAALLSMPHGLGWLLQRPPTIATVSILGIAGSVYGTVLAYTELPLAWASWSAR
jgi:hypothetical protein